MTNTHIAALFPTGTAAQAARGQLIAAGVDATRLLVLDRGHSTAGNQPHAPRGFWQSIRQFLVPDDVAHRYADAIVRGHPLLVADVTQAERETALSVLRAAAPISLEAHDENARKVDAGPADEGDPWARPRRTEQAAAGSEGIVAGGVIAGDYGAVGATNVRMDTDILRGKRIPA